MAAILAALAAGLALGGGRPGPLGWAVLALAALGGLYQDRWEFDAGAEQARHRTGLCCAARTRTFGFASIERFRIVALAPGTVPGTAAARDAQGAALAEAGERDGELRGPGRRQAWLDLVLEDSGGRLRLLQRCPARRGAILRERGERIAALCGKPLRIG
jgi:hypothetical protein